MCTRRVHRHPILSASLHTHTPLLFQLCMYAHILSVSLSLHMYTTCSQATHFFRNIWMSLVTYKRVMSHINESCHIWISHVTSRVQRHLISSASLHEHAPLLFELYMHTHILSVSLSLTAHANAVFTGIPFLGPHYTHTTHTHTHTHTIHTHIHVCDMTHSHTGARGAWLDICSTVHIYSHVWHAYIIRVMWLNYVCMENL